jgi:phosphoglycolate phosphatase/AHBA synthesis associated protein
MIARAVLFDLDGVLVDSYEVWFALLRALTVELGYPELGRETFRALWGQGIQADVETIFPRQTVPELERLYAERFGGHLARLEVAEGVPETFAALRARGVGTAVITNTPAVMARALVERAGGTPDVLVGGTDVANAKPAPDMVLLACAKLGVDAPAAWVVGDTAYDRDAARAAGARFAGIGIDGDLRLARVGELLAALDAAAPRRG